MQDKLTEYTIFIRLNPGIILAFQKFPYNTCFDVLKIPNSCGGGRDKLGDWD